MVGLTRMDRLMGGFLRVHIHAANGIHNGCRLIFRRVIPGMAMIGHDGRSLIGK
jgi:hypothetical protein